MPSSGAPPEHFSSDQLVEIAPRAFQEILTCAKNKKPLPSTLGSRISVTLHLIAKQLEVMQPFQLPTTAQDLSYRTLKDFLRICKWPGKTATPMVEDYEVFHISLQSPSSYEIYKELMKMFTSQPSMMRAGISNFLAAKQTIVELYANRFQELLDLLEPDNRKLNGVGQSSLHSKHLTPCDEYVYPDDIRENLIRALKEHATCISSVHKSEAPTGINPRHPTRLGLSTRGRKVKKLIEFDLVMAFIDFKFWQDFSLHAVLPDARPELSADSMAAGGLIDDVDPQSIMEAGEVCRILERQRNSQSSIKLRLKLDNDCHMHKHQLAQPLPYVKPHGKGLSLAELLDLGQYDLTPKVKIILSFAVARTFWEFYGSELTAARWSSEDIWFIRRFTSRTSGDQFELKAFVNLPFGRGPLGPQEYLLVDDLTHSYPRILSLGIILLEIGHGKKLGILPLAASENLGELRDSVNDAHSHACSQLAALNDVVWETCKYKTAFDTAISNCLDPSKFIESPSTRKQRVRLTPNEYEKRAVHDRREAIYHNVVSQLYWLAKIGHKDEEDDLVINSRQQLSAKARRKTTFSNDTDEAEIQELWKRVQNPTFNSDLRVEGSAESWFEGIRTISEWISRQSRKTKLRPVRIALLDSGCDVSLKSFEAAKCFKGWHDFAADPPSETEVDEYGHGTFMARLVMHMVPGCELYLARVAQTRQHLEHNEEVVAKAIRYAGTEWEVDVISMSFGFPKFSQAISDAIHDVRKAREDAIVFIASVGNNVNRAEAYPACDPSVISIYATESTGAFIKTNPYPPSGESPRLLGTYGDNIPDVILAELRARFKEGDFSSGTSVATAVAAGIIGLMLAYAALLPQVLRGCGAEGVHSDLKRTDGMRHMLFGMANSWNERQYFINPIRFWSYGANHSTMYQRICRALPHKEVM